MSTAWGRCRVCGSMLTRKGARCRCRCGETFYGPDRLTALDSHTAHLIAIQALDVFDLMEEES